MKKIIALVFTCVIAMSMVACSKSEEGGKTPSDAKTYDVAAIAETVGKEVEFDNSADMGEDYIMWLGVKSDDVKAFAGKYCKVSTSFDIVCVVEANDGSVDNVKTALESKKAEISAQNDLYDQSVVEKMDASRIVVKDNIVIWSTCGVAEDIEAAYSAVDAAIESALK